MFCCDAPPIPKLAVAPFTSRGISSLVNNTLPGNLRGISSLFDNTLPGVTIGDAEEEEEEEEEDVDVAVEEEEDEEDEVSSFSVRCFLFEP